LAIEFRSTWIPSPGAFAALICSALVSTGPKNITAVVALRRLSTLKENSNYAEKRDSAFGCDGFISFRKSGALVRSG